LIPRAFALALVHDLETTGPGSVWRAQRAVVGSLPTTARGMERSKSFSASCRKEQASSLCSPELSAADKSLQAVSKSEIACPLFIPDALILTFSPG
jgi:hypothetical protein